MRLFELNDNWHHEIQREVLKRGKWVITGRMQDMDVSADDGYHTKEIANYSYGLLGVNDLDKVKKAMSHCDFTWADAEFNERVSDEEINPGVAWLIRKNVWTPFLKRNNGKFAYSYNERYRVQLKRIIDELRKHPYTRQAVLSMWDIHADNKKIGIDRVPCSVYYQFLYRDGALHIIYNMRSCDIFTHYHNDIYLSIRLLHHVANEAGMHVGNFYMNVGSLHAYKKDIPQEMLENMY